MVEQVRLGMLGEAYDFSVHKRLLDVGGGSGVFPIEPDRCSHASSAGVVVSEWSTCRARLTAARSARSGGVGFHA